MYDQFEIDCEPKTIRRLSLLARAGMVEWDSNLDTFLIKNNYADKFSFLTEEQKSILNDIDDFNGRVILAEYDPEDYYTSVLTYVMDKELFPCYIFNDDGKIVKDINRVNSLGNFNVDRSNFIINTKNDKIEDFAVGQKSVIIALTDHLLSYSGDFLITTFLSQMAVTTFPSMFVIPMGSSKINLFKMASKAWDIMNPTMVEAVNKVKRKKNRYEILHAMGILNVSNLNKI